MRKLAVVLAAALAGNTGGGCSSSGLAPGVACTTNGQCQSDVCGVTGAGKCCSAACSTTDATCGATGCDATGACIYPAAVVSCGTASCVGSALTGHACNGSGACAPSAQTPCPDNLACKDGTSCHTQCLAASDCASGFQCDAATSRCLAKQATGPCTTNDSCASGFCGVSGSGNCCATQCMAVSGSACNATDCDAITGACSYPVGRACGTIGCSGQMLTAGSCDATGACQSATSACPNNLICNTAGTACLATCGATSDCVAGFYCNNGACQAQVTTGPCTENDDCASGICGVGGRGFCCTVACSTTNPICGASGCDATGACVYPDKTVSCGLAQSCVGSTQSDAYLCDGKGACPTPAIVDCSPYTCDDTIVPPACVTSCQSASSCVAGAFCDAVNDTCCTLTSGGSLSVDGVFGNDDAGCCGVGSTVPCQTIARAMTLIDAAKATGVTIAATVDGGGGDWAPAGEIYPIELGWGVELNAPGVYFLDPDGMGGVGIIEVGPYSSNDSLGYASIVGSATDPIGVGMNAANTLQLNDVIAVSVVGTLYIANASVNGSATSANPAAAFFVNTAATLVLGQDQSSTVTGTVQIGNAAQQLPTDGFIGIFCNSGGPQSPSVIRDAALQGKSSVVIQGQLNGPDIIMLDYCNVSLSSNPVFGVPPISIGAGKCGPSKHDNVGISMLGQGTASLSNATIQCITGYGASLSASGAGLGNPTLSIDNSIVQNTGAGVAASAGVATVTNSTIRFNFVGVEQVIDPTGSIGSIDLSGGGDAVICGARSEDSNATMEPSVDVYNATVAPLNASNVAWDTAGPDYFTCDSTLSVCTCNLSSCATDAGSDGMDAVEDSINLGGINTTGNSLSPWFLDAGCQ